MDSTIVATIISLFLLLIGAVVGGGVTYKVTKSIERRKILSEKYEVIYDFSVQIRDWLKNENARWLLLAEPGESVFPAFEDLPCPMEKLIMMADLYAPSLEKEVSKVKQEVAAIKNLKWENAESGGAQLQGITVDTFNEDNRMADTAHNDLVNAIKKLTKTNLF